MESWYRVFGRADAPPAPAALLAHLAGLGLPVTGQFRTEEGAWFQAELALGAGGPIQVERFLASEEGIRAELNGWAAYLETCEHSPHHQALMERTIQSHQLFTVRRPLERPDEERAKRVCVELCRFLALATDGFYQADGEGFFEVDGTLLIREL